MSAHDPIYRESAIALEAMGPHESTSWMNTLMEILTLPIIYREVQR